MLTDPSGKPYRFNAEQHEAVVAEFIRTNSVKEKRRPGDTSETPPVSQPDEESPEGFEDQDQS